MAGDGQTSNLFAQLFPFEASKSQKRQLAIIEATIDHIYNQGIGKLSLESVAKSSGMSRPLLKHYFADMDELLLQTFVYLRARFQAYVIGQLSAKAKPLQMLRKYVNAHFDWLENFPELSTVWLIYFFECCRQEQFKKQHSEFTRMGAERIAAMLERANETGDIELSNSMQTAKRIQLILTGALINGSTENKAFGRKNGRKETWDLVELLLD